MRCGRIAVENWDLSPDSVVICENIKWSDPHFASAPTYMGMIICDSTLPWMFSSVVISLRDPIY